MLDCGTQCAERSVGVFETIPAIFSIYLNSEAAGSRIEASESPAPGEMEDMKLTIEPFLEFSPVLGPLARESSSLSKTLLKTRLLTAALAVVGRRV